MHFTLYTVFVSILLSTILARCTAVPESRDLNNEPRTDATCGDPSLAEIYYEGFSPSRTAHVLESHSAFVHTTSNGADWQLQKAVFLAWKTPQTGTLPFFRLAAAGSAPPDFVFAISTTGNPPVVSGFSSSPAIIGYVYPTQTCGSVPLFVVFLPSTTDHYYTVDATERDELVNTFGWTDQGIAAFVLPID